MPVNHLLSPSLRVLSAIDNSVDCWKNCGSILVIRTDHMGDVIMSSPAIKSLKRYTGAKITLLISPEAAPCLSLIEGIDDFIVADLPWMNPQTDWQQKELAELTAQITARKFDGCVIFTVYSQSALPAALLAWQAGIAFRLAYSRENPYQLLTHWLPDEEPYIKILHQVQRDLALVAAIMPDNSLDESYYRQKIKLLVPEHAQRSISTHLLDQPTVENKQRNKSGQYIIFHTGASEQRRNYPLNRWIELGKAVLANFGLPIFLTGTQKDNKINQIIKKHLESHGSVCNLSGQLSLEEFAAFILKAKLLVSVNTGAVHIASGVNTPVITLYARTNPQHIPWKVKGAVFEYDIAESIKSQNQVIHYVDCLLYKDKKTIPFDQRAT